MLVNQNNFANPKRRVERFLAVVLSLLLAFTWLNENKAQAQDSETGSDWSVPLNISNSGSARKPFLIKDSNNNPLVFWEDTFSGFQYRYLLDGKWSVPAKFPMPFSARSVPLKNQLIHGVDGNTYFSWIDDGKKLYYSNLKLAAVDKLAVWKPAQLISSKVENFGFTVDDDSNVHIAYVVGQDTDAQKAGVYYTKISSEGTVLKPVEMDQSPYFRRSSEVSGTGEFDPSLATVGVGRYGSGPESTVLISWNNPVTKRLFLRRSVNGGTDWEEPLEIVSPDERSANQIPQRPAFAVIGDIIHFLWQNNQENASCVQYYQTSTDRGSSWSDRQVLLGELNGCPEQNTVYNGADQKNFLLFILNSQIYLAPFRDGELEAPQVQVGLSSFSDATTYNNVRLQSQQALLAGDQLYFTGAGIGSSSDIWILSRSINTLFIPQGGEATWSNPKVVAQVQDPIKNIWLLASDSDRLHAFWAQPDGMRNNDPGTAIYYGSWTEAAEITPRSILTSPEGTADQPSAVVDASGRMHVVWSGGKSEELYSSYSDMQQASTQLDWFSPTTLPLTSPAATNPILKVGLDGTLFVAYLTPVNEQRGVYVTRSQDRGATWSVPVLVFDAVEQNCGMLEHLSYVISAEGTQHLAWMCSTIPGGLGAYALNYARSSDQGLTWTVKQDENEKTLVWGEVAGLSQQNIHLVWIEYTNRAYKLKEQISRDDGGTWSPVEEIDSFNERVGLSVIAVDPGGKIYLLVTLNETGNVVLNSRNWNGESWSAAENKKIITEQTGLLNSLSAIVLPKGELIVLYSVEKTSESTGLTTGSLMYLSRPIVISPEILVSVSHKETLAAAQATPTAVVNEVPPNVEITAAPQPTIDLKALKETGSPRTNSILIYAVGAILALVVVIFVVIVSQYRRLNK